MTRKVESQNVQIAVIAEKIDNIESVVADIKKKLEVSYVTKEEFLAKMTIVEGKYDPIQKIVYGMVTLILTSVVGALLMLVIRK